MEWNEIVAESERIGTLPRTILQEELQKSVLTYLSRKGVFQTIVFQGGTALRLFYGNPRFSEDIDLVVREGSEFLDLAEPLNGLDNLCRTHYPFLVEFDLRQQKKDDFLQRYIFKARSDVVDIRLHIEMANVPSYKNNPRLMDYPPFQPPVRVEERSEILADKVRALTYRPYLKGRDLWDIYYLTRDSSLELDWNLVKKKVNDYHEHVHELEERLAKLRGTLDSSGPNALKTEMRRFLPEPSFEGFLNDIPSIIRSVIELISDYEPGVGR